jgi:uncharacterized protein (DUF433 family)
MDSQTIRMKHAVRFGNAHRHAASAIARFFRGVPMMCKLYEGEYPMNPHPRISIDPAVMVGKACIKGTRITVELILRLLAEGYAAIEIIEDYPHLAQEDVKAALAYGAALAAKPVTEQAA